MVCGLTPLQVFETGEVRWGACAGMAGKVTLVPAGQEASEEERDADLAAFLQEVHTLIEMEPEKMTGTQHIDRLFRPGSKYFNMNPFEVLGLDWDADPELLFTAPTVKVPTSGAVLSHLQGAFTEFLRRKFGCVASVKRGPETEL